ncbi:DUF969 domain-containing protein [Sphingopyxis sp.]|uniref:DUF969 domain-containing protein n=1 Tax=Sphingopyxis sp. TaxID=1908224 RepID=UPI0010FA2F4E|nr:DUF969 domain-containing protein [Sphingopyxis sp.]MBR2171600.1 DUF969 domain-containing protein [Sphingopyxis sp.]
MLVLIGILIIIAGFLLRFNPLLVIMASALATGLAAGLDIAAIVAAFGKAFNDTRYVSIIWIVLPVIGLLEAYGLQQHARSLIGRIRSGAVGGLLIGYLLIRQIFAALGLTSVAGHPQTVRPLVAPMAEAAAEAQNPALTIAQREEVKAYSAATDNVGLFFGEDIFLAIGSILLMKGVLDGYGYQIEPLHFSLWAIPTAIAAFVIHSFRLWRLDKRMRAPAERGA